MPTAIPDQSANWKIAKESTPALADTFKPSSAAALLRKCSVLLTYPSEMPCGDEMQSWIPER
jgi:hypothetical protein